MVGKILGHYQIIERLGQGGMGVVYKARDLHLDRLVALKVLPPETIADTERKQRFTREAKSASALNHPGIITIHDITTDGGVDFIVMEYVEGKTLDQLIRQKGIRVSEALQIGIEITDALAAAHSIGIIHRDIKPSNIIVSDKGRAKVLDFGLVKLKEPAQAAASTIQTAEAAALTDEGRIVGTVYYMSPEQAEGKEVDARSDVFSFGSVLYEMVTGRRAFEGPSVISTLSAIMHQNPQPVAETVAGAPPELQRIIARCLRKAPERRFQSIADVGVVLQELRDDLQSGVPMADGVPKAVSPPRAAIGRLGLFAVALVLVGVAAGFWITRQRPALDAPVLTRLTFDSGLTFEPALSPDGKLVAYASDRSGAGNLDIWVQQMAGGQPVPLTRDAADDREPSFSPDGSKIAFRSERDGGGIYVVPAIGGDERLIARYGRSPRFSPDGQWIVYWIGPPPSIDGFAPCCGKIFVVPSTGAQSRQLRQDFPDSRHPTWAPDGKHILFFGTRNPDYSDVDWWVTPIDGGDAVRTGAYGAFGPPGFLNRYAPAVSPSMWLGRHVIFAVPLGDTTNLWRIPISSSNWRVTGAPERVTFGAGLETQPSMSTEGRGGASIAFANVTSPTHIWSLPIDPIRAQATGELKRLTTSADDRHPSLSADGRTLVFSSNRTGNTDVWIKDLSNGRESALTATPLNEGGPKVTLDGSKVAYNTADPQGSPVNIDVVSTAGGVPERVCRDCGIVWDWSSDGRRILFAVEGPRVPSMFVGALDTVAARKSDFLKHPRYPLVVPRFSPDDKWVAVIAQAGPDRTQILLVRCSGNVTPAEAEWIPITDGATFEDKVRWSPDGGLIYFTSDRDGFRCLWAQRLDAATKHPVGPPVPVYHFHTARRSLLNTGILRLEISIARDKIVFNLGEITGNIWLAQLKSW